MATSNGNDNNNSIAGTAAADVLSGLGGNDTLSGGSSSDTIYGGTGHDVAEGGDGADHIYGGQGNDYISGADLVDPGAAAASNASNPAVSSDDGADDALFGGAGDDVILGNNGDDYLSGGDGADSLYGGAGNDEVSGGAGADYIDGGDGDDTIYGGYGIDAGPNTGFGQSGNATQINQTIAGNQSPPVTLVTQDGTVVHVWVDGEEIQGRLFDAYGDPISDQFSLTGSYGVSTRDTFDWDNLDVDELANGDVMISYVRSPSDGGEAPTFTIIDPSVDPNTAGFVVSEKNLVQSTDATGIESPPMTTVLDDGNVLFVWSDNGASDDVTSMDLYGRIYDPDTGTYTSTEFEIGGSASWSIDGYTAFDTDNLDVVQLANGNVVIGYVRNTAEMPSDEPVFSIITPTGKTVAVNQEIQETDTTTYEGPPQIVALDDGGFATFWLNSAETDDNATMVIEARIFDENGVPQTGDLPVTKSAVDGFDGYDVENFTVEDLGGGLVAVGYVSSSVTTAGNANLPQFSIFDTSTGANVVSDVSIAQSPSHIWGGAPVITAVGDGNFVAVYAEGNAASGGVTGINYRIFDGNGDPLTDAVSVTTNSATSGLNGSDAWDWSNLDADYNATSNSFVISWVGAGDGSGTAVYSSGPIAAPGGMTFPATSDGDKIAGGDGQDIIYGAEGDDVISGDDGNDSLFGGGGNDSLIGGAGNDVIDGGDGNDTIRGGLGEDTVTGGAGNDTIYVAEGDSVAGGEGDDVFVVEDLGEAGAGVYTIDGGTGGQTNGDTLDLQGLYVPGSISATETSPGEYSGTVTMLDGSVINFRNIDNIICFARGTQIETMTGAKPVETLKAGDLVMTLDKGAQPIRWIGERALDADHLALHPNHLPIRLPAGCLGENTPAYDLILSPQHRVLIANRVAERMFGSHEILVPAKKLVGFNGIHVLEDVQNCEYWHFLLDGHHAIYSNRALTETLYPAQQSLQSVSCEGRKEMLELFPELRDQTIKAACPPCRPIVKGAQLSKFLERTSNNGKELVDLQQIWQVDAGAKRSSC